MTRETDPAIVKRIERLERIAEQHGLRIEDLERAGSPDGIADASAVDERQQQVAQFCQFVRQTHGESQTDLIGGA